MPSISCRNYFFNFILVQTWLIFHKNGFALSFILKVEVLKLENGLFFRIFSNGSLRLFSDMCAWSLTSIPMVWVKTTILADSMRITKLSKKTNSERKEMLLVRIQVPEVWRNVLPSRSEPKKFLWNRHIQGNVMIAPLFRSFSLEVHPKLKRPWF